MRSFKTPKGTVLPLLDLRGKDYLQVANRLVWFREEKPTWRIHTEFVQSNDDMTIAKASIIDDAGNVIATAHKREDRAHFADHLEKSETSAVGRALAYCGYGTQFCADELDEGERISDAPIDRKPQTNGNPTESKIDFGKYKGTTVSGAIDMDGLPAVQKYVQWLIDSAEKQKKPLPPNVQEFKRAVDKYAEASK